MKGIKKYKSYVDEDWQLLIPKKLGLAKSNRVFVADFPDCLRVYIHPKFLGLSCNVWKVEILTTSNGERKIKIPQQLRESLSFYLWPALSFVFEKNGGGYFEIWPWPAKKRCQKNNIEEIRLLFSSRHRC